MAIFVVFFSVLLSKMLKVLHSRLLVLIKFRTDHMSTLFFMQNCFQLNTLKILCLFMEHYFILVILPLLIKNGFNEFNNRNITVILFSILKFPNPFLFKIPHLLTLWTLGTFLYFYNYNCSKVELYLLNK